MKTALLSLRSLFFKAHFDPNQPRVPRGGPKGGQWTRGGGTSGGRSRPSKPARAPGKVFRRPPKSYKKPRLGKIRPNSAAKRTYVITQLARWALQKAKDNPAKALVIVRTVLIARHWVSTERAIIVASLNPPKSLIELKEAANSPKKGYEIHHVVEKIAARKAGYDRSKIENRHNKVRIPTLKHREITARFASGNKDYGGKSPREYLQDKNWRERAEVGIYAMKKFGVLK